MEIEKATVMGFCYGVRRALRLLQEAAQKYGQLETLGPVVHNEQAVARLREQGISPVSEIEELKCRVVAIPTHGVPPQVKQRLESRFQAIDATCPWVSRAQKAAQKLAQAGFFVLVYGDGEHPEVKGILGCAQGQGRAELGEVSFPGAWPKRLGILAQTTRNPAEFARFVKQVVDAALGQVIELRVINTICDATQQRHAAALELAQKADLIIVVGGRHSSNTRRLVEACSATGAETHQVETANEIEPNWLRGHRRVGITAGASTPDEVIEGVIKCLKSLSPVEV